MAKEIKGVEILEHKTEKKDGKDKTTVMDRCINFLERDTRAIEIITYGATTLGLITALYKIRPFAKFTKPSDVPSRFIKLRVPLKGVAVRIEPSHGALIMVNHKPLVALPRFGAAKHLPIKVAGVNVTNHGISWLQTVVNGKEIEFIPVAISKDYLDCTIKLQETKESTLSIGEELVRLGFGTIGSLESHPANDETILAYKAALSAAQKRAKFERNGFWHFMINPTYLWKIQRFLYSKLSQVLPIKKPRQLTL